MSVIARCATFVATKTSLKQQFAVNNRSSATKIVRPYSAVASINKKAFVDAVAEAAGVEKKVAENVVNAALGVVTASVAAGEKITLTGFGTFERKMRSAREGRNPKTGDPLKIPAAAYPSFSAGKSFKDAVKK
ncbi:unnamed protein product [Bathycoccus prasinos]|uniref:DNA-binding protein HU n=1 Tax=Bathycoccus prasinos TaxID=41875 RepID=K8FA20_9CHLO|nr:DNA-binding protein HU [Bathycoccus prasinos]CCO18443.1 DNA-binding protein HU [Bathycoccus prasinos]|mmetsp:Transcript_7047/g.21902  ORF Transcript_7047/g.21902 Transcript_7047/m.21902 type:complete len:133 (-) Transcript_7047:1380-1778(-)|eukprot:XP_007510098.1 DNA-binding protein HU [Bathycoccus prasinos]